MHVDEAAVSCLLTLYYLVGLSEPGEQTVDADELCTFLDLLHEQDAFFESRSLLQAWRTEVANGTICASQTAKHRRELSNNLLRFHLFPGSQSTPAQDAGTQTDLDCMPHERRPSANDALLPLPAILTGACPSTPEGVVDDQVDTRNAIETENFPVTQNDSRDGSCATSNASADESSPVSIAPKAHAMSTPSHQAEDLQHELGRERTLRPRPDPDPTGESPYRHDPLKGTDIGIGKSKKSRKRSTKRPIRRLSKQLSDAQLYDSMA